MEQTIHTPETYDFRKYDQIWRRVAPNLEPYPDLAGGARDGAPGLWCRTAGFPAAGR